jgi:hypothetical protein
MDKPVFNPLVALENKPEVTSIPVVNIRFLRARKSEEEEKPAVKIVNKRRGPEYRDEILKRLITHSDIPFVKISEGMKKTPLGVLSKEEVITVEPLKKGKRLVIRDTIVKGPDVFMEKIEEEIVPEQERLPPAQPVVEDIDRDINDDVEVEEEVGKEVEVEGEVGKEVEVEGEVGKEVEVKPVEVEKKKRGRKPKVKEAIVETEPKVDLTTAVIRTQKVADRLPKERERITIPVSNFYMNNRKMFIQKLSEMFKSYRQEILSDKAEVSCDSLASSRSFDLLTHQKIARDYLNLYTPYRGLLLYLSLGSGKSCTSIAVAEGMKTNKRIVVMTPASLKTNFFNELKKCGDVLYKRNQFWEFISIDGHPEYVGILSSALSLSSEYVRKNGGAWLVNVNKESNYSELSPEDQTKVDTQLDEMIRSKYTDINYNGLRMDKLKTMTDGLRQNPFDNSVVIIDEAHNFVSRIVNKLKKADTVPYQLYEFLLSANNARIVLLTGSPIINYPNEIGILYNILRGYIKTWSFTLNVTTSEKITTDTILTMFDNERFKTYDFVEYAGNVLTVTRNPFGFTNTKKRGVVKGTVRAPRKKEAEVVGGNKTKKNRGLLSALFGDQRAPIMQGGMPGDVFNKYGGVHLDEQGNISDSEFQQRIIQILKKNGVEVQMGSIKVVNNKALPDNPDDFFTAFINPDTAEFQNISLFQRRILGLTSYYRSAQETLLPTLVKTSNGDDYYVERIPMSSEQFGIYEKIRKEEADKERNAKKRKRMAKGVDDLYSISSTYRIFSRAACNFVFPPSIERPLPNIKATEEGEDMDENNFDAVPADRRQEVDAFSSIEDEERAKGSATELLTYEGRIKKVLEDIAAKSPSTGESEFLSKTALLKYSPKFAKILENLQNPENEGLHLVYSHFRTIEGIGLLKLILEANGFAEFKLEKSGDIWEWTENEADVGKPTFTLYTGTEDEVEKEIKRNIYNGAWDLVPSNIATKLRERAENNDMGEVIKIFMITSSGAEGINLKNTRFVHIVEPYWHMVRVDQVVGRARRICSHQDLPEDMRNVKVYLYVTVFSEQQKTDEKNIELRIRDVSRLDQKTPVTTDETLYEIASTKQRTNNQILKAMKETAIDCQLYASTSKRAVGDENLVCYGFGKVESNQYSSYPTFEEDKGAKEGLDVQRIKWTAQKISQDGKDYALNRETMEVYDYESYKKALEFGSEPLLIGKLVRKSGKYIIE